MSKLTSLYHGYLKEREETMNEYTKGTNSLQNLFDYLQTKLNARDYSTAEELINAVVSETEEQGFQAGCKYTYELGLELGGNK